MAGTFIATGSYSNLTRLELEQLRRGDYAAGGKALTIGDSGLAPEGVVGPGSVNAEAFYSAPYTTFEEIVSFLPPDSPGKMLGKTFEVYPNGDVGSWLGPTEITRAAGSSAVVNASSELLDGASDFVSDGVQAGDLVLFYLGGGTNLSFGTASVASVDSSTQLTLTSILLDDNSTSFGGLWPAYEYSIVRPTAVQLFAVPGSGPLGQEQTFLFVDPASTLHSNAGPTVDLINADRITNLIPPKYNKDATVDRADAVYRSPAPGGHLGQHGYRIVLYPDNGSGTGPNLSSPITALNPVIDPAIPAGDQRMTVDYAAGVIRFSCAPVIGGDIKVSGGVNATTGRLNLYAVAWCFNRTADNNASAYRLYEPTATETSTGLPAQIKWESPTWAIRGLKSDGGQSLIKVAGNTAADQQLRIMEAEDPINASIVGKLNAQLVTVGNGTTTFGDYNGATAIEDAFAASPSGNLTIRAKAGTYALTGAIELGNELTIIGESANSVILNVNTPASSAISIDSGARLNLENLQIRKNTAATSRIQIHGSFRAKNCLFRSTYLWVTHASTSGFPSGVTSGTTQQDAVYVEDCILDGSGYANQSPIRFLVEDTPSVRGVTFKNCVIRGADTGDALVYVENILAAGPDTCTISDITFENCQLQPHACASTSATVIAKPSGVFYAEPGSTTDQLTINNLRFINCNVSIATNGGAVGNTILMNISPIAYDASATTNRVIYGTVRVQGGTWQTPSGRGTNVPPFFLQCLNPEVENVTFIGGATASSGYNTAPGYNGHGYYTASQRTALRDTTSINPGVNEAPIGWATIAASGSAIEAVPDGTRNVYKTGLTVRNISLNNLHRQASTGAIVLVGPNIASGPAAVDGVYINNPAQGTANSNVQLVGQWLAIFTGGTGATNRGTRGYFRNLVFRTGANTLTTGARWANFAVMEFCPEGHLRVEDVVIAPSALNGDTSTFNDCPGVRLAWNWNLLAAAALPAIQQGPFFMRGGIIRYTSWGVRMLADKTCTQPLGPWVFEDVLVEQNTTQPASLGGPNSGFMFDYANQTPGGVTFRNCEVRCKMRSTGDAFYYNAWYLTNPTWPRSAQNSFLNCKTYLDAGANFLATNSAAVFVESANASSNPSFTFLGNTFHGTFGGFTNSPYYIRLQRTTGVALTSPSLGGGGYYRGAEIGHNTANGQQYLYTTGQPMVFNDALLLTP